MKPAEISQMLRATGSEIEAGFSALGQASKMLRRAYEQMSACHVALDDTAYLDDGQVILTGLRQALESTLGAYHACSDLATQAGVLAARVSGRG